ncbi:MAG: hypothetical protein LBT70_01915 [Holosporaceae bacterium]|jgi:lipopolysaccharide biosynthesis glycosyltransferase|nr:hypothetical protein [Holosporaceae bacterium]
MNFRKKVLLFCIPCILGFNTTALEIDPDAINVVYITNRANFDYTLTSVLSVLENSSAEFSWGNSDYEDENQDDAISLQDNSKTDIIKDKIELMSEQEETLSFDSIMGTIESMSEKEETLSFDSERKKFFNLAIAQEEHEIRNKREELLNFNIIMDEPNFNADDHNDKAVKLVDMFHTRCNRYKNNYNLKCLSVPKEEREKLAKFNSGEFPKTIFLKLFLCRFLPYERCLYLSTDTICIEDIRKIWNTNLDNFYIGACNNKDPFKNEKNERKMYNCGVLLMNLRRMQECKLANEIEELLAAQVEAHGYYGDFFSDEDVLYVLSQKYPYTGVLEIDPGFNMCAQYIPRNFLGKDITFKTRGLLLPINIVNYYFPSNYVLKPWLYGLSRRFEEYKCPDYQNLEHEFWKLCWKDNPWSFHMWNKHYKEFMDQVKSFTYADLSKLVFSPIKIDGAVDIVYIADRNYFDCTFVSLLSVLENSTSAEKKRAETLSFHIIIDELDFNGTPDKWMQNLQKAFYTKYDNGKDKYNYNIQFLPFPQEARKYVDQFASYIWPKSIFLKLYLSKIFKDYDKCLYLDGDTICFSDIMPLWNIDLKNHCFGGCSHCEIAGRHPNAGVLPMNLKKMRECGFVEEVEKLILKNQAKKQGEYAHSVGIVYAEELSMGDYALNHPEDGWLKIDGGFNAAGHGIPNDFTGIDNNSEICTTITESGLVYELSKDDYWKINLTIIHYYYIGELAFKPWQNNSIVFYEAVGCPDYRDLENDFWKHWGRNPWSFWVWYSYYAKYKNVKNIAQNIL